MLPPHGHLIAASHLAGLSWPPLRMEGTRPELVTVLRAQHWWDEAQFLPSPCYRQVSVCYRTTGSLLNLATAEASVCILCTGSLKPLCSFPPLKGLVIYHRVSGTCLVNCIITVRLSVRIPLQSFTERYKILRKPCGSNKKRVCEKSNHHPVERKGTFL